MLHIYICSINIFISSAIYLLNIVQPSPLILKHFHHLKQNRMSSTPTPAPGTHAPTFCLWIRLLWTCHRNGVTHPVALRI